MEEKEIINSSKYNQGVHIPLDSIIVDDLEIALKDFSNGSLALSKCLRVMWIHGLKTYSCNPGESNPFGIGHITMEEGEDIFSYLSEEFLNNDKIRRYVIDGRQEIRFVGSLGEKEGVMLFLAREIQSGKKVVNPKSLIYQIGEPFPNEWVRRLRTYEANPNSTYWGEKVYIKKK